MLPSTPANNKKYVIAKFKLKNYEINVTTNCVNYYKLKGNSNDIAMK
jgi:hypothetical protein